MTKRSTMIGMVVLTGLAFAFGGMIWAQRDLAAGEQSLEQEAIQAPDFALTSLDGQRYVLSELRGKVVLVNFWATWCGPCRMEIPDLSRIYSTYRDTGVMILGISLDELQDEQIRTFARNYKMTYPVLHGTPSELARVVRAYGGIQAIPTTFLIDRQGYLQEMYVGARNEAFFLADISKYL